MDSDTIFNLAVLVGVIVASGASVIVGVRQTKTNKDIQEVKHEVQTMNELTIGQLGEAEESRRIHGMPKDERSRRETRHIEQQEDRKDR